MSTQIGHPFPQFSLPAAVPQGDNIVEQTMSNDDLRGRTTVVFFYPKDATSGCTVEVCGFRDLYPEFEKLNVQVIGVSRDTVSSHKRFIQNQNLPYPLIADNERVLIDGLELLIHKTMYGKPVTGVLRNTFVLDKAGNIARIFEKVTPLGHAQEVLDCVRSL
ncbi:MAG TPA: peroxiredoxin [Abditibacteriaceae bacterium]|jgi:peroxiredoxin Q/BCP